MFTHEPAVKPTTSENVWGVIGAMLLPVAASLAAVVAAALSGFLIQFCFTATFTDLLILVGLGKYSLWQVYAALTGIAVAIRPIISVMR
jgi:hypothetical protein